MMNKMIAPDHRNRLAGLFSSHKRYRVIIDAVLERGYGTAIADSENGPEVGLVQLGAFTILGGRPDHPFTHDLIRDLSYTMIIPESGAWSDIVIKIHGTKLKKQRWVGFSFEKLNHEHLCGLKQHVPEGYRIQRIDLKLASRAMGRLSYPSPEAFIENGVGFCALKGDEVVCGARSYTNTRKAIEISIMTVADHRGKGVATATGASLAAHCLDKGIEPHWNAENSISVKLAEKLGYIPNDEFEAFNLFPSEPDPSLSYKKS